LLFADAVAFVQPLPARLLHNAKGTRHPAVRAFLDTRVQEFEADLLKPKDLTGGELDIDVQNRFPSPQIRLRESPYSHIVQGVRVAAGGRGRSEGGKLLNLLAQEATKKIVELGERAGTPRGAAKQT
jgi:hypothetical protein